MTHDCEQNRELASMFLDGRLVAARRADVQDHLRACEACTLFFRSLRRLASHARQLPTAEAAPDLAEQVRDRLRRRSTGVTSAHLDRRLVAVRRRRLLVAAVMILLPLGGIAWLLRGAFTGDGLVDVAELSQPKRSATEIWDACRADGVEPGLFARAGRGLVGDLALSRDLQPTECRAMLAVQLDLFDLERSGARLLRASEAHDGTQLVLDLRRLARFVIDLAEDIDRPQPGFDLHRWQRVAMNSKLYNFAELAADRGWQHVAVPESLDQLVARVASDLSPASQTSLTTLLLAKSNWVKGEHRASIRLAAGLDSLDEDSAFAASLDYVLASSLYAADRPSVAEPFVRRLTERFAGTGPSAKDPLAGAWLEGVVDAELASIR